MVRARLPANLGAVLRTPALVAPQVLPPGTHSKHVPDAIGQGRAQPSASIQCGRLKRLSTFRDNAKRLFRQMARREQRRLKLGKIKYWAYQAGEEIIRSTLGSKSHSHVGPLGKPVTYTKSKTGSVYQIMVSTSAGEYGGTGYYQKRQRWKHYKQWASVLDASGQSRMIATEILRILQSATKADWSSPRLTPPQERAVSSLLATLTTSEPYRRDGAGKAGRAALRAIAKGNKTFGQAFAGDDPMFVLAGAGGCQQYDAITDDPRFLPTENQLELLGYVSSTDDEEEDDSSSS